MHELSLCQSMIQQVTEAAQGTRVRKVFLNIGKWSGADRGSIEFCFPLVAEGTIASGADLVIEEIPVRLACRSCGERMEIEQPVLQCAQCGSSETEIVSGREFFLTSIEVDDE